MSDVRFHQMKQHGADAESVYRAIREQGLGQIEAIRILRSVFGLSLQEAKEITIVAGGVAASLSEHEGRVATDLRQALEDDDEQQN